MVTNDLHPQISISTSIDAFGDIYPSVDDLVEQYVHDSPQGKLYLRAKIRLLDELKGTSWRNGLHFS